MFIEFISTYTTTAISLLHVFLITVVILTVLGTVIELITNFRSLFAIINHLFFIWLVLLIVLALIIYNLFMIVKIVAVMSHRGLISIGHAFAFPLLALYDIIFNILNPNLNKEE